MTTMLRAILMGLCICGVGFWAKGAMAQQGEEADEVAGTLFVRAEDGASRPVLALATDVEIGVSGLVARVRVRQEFRNDSDLWLDGTYVFPLPEMAAVDRMVLQIGERRIEGRIQEKAEAKRTFQKAKAEGRTASLLDQERPNLFTMAVANIGPREIVDIEIEYQQTVAYAQGSFELRFPMTLTARYVPGGDTGDETAAPEHFTFVDGTGWGTATPAVPDAARITPPILRPGSGVVNPLMLRVELDPGLPLARVESPSHAVEVTSLEGDAKEIWLDGVPADRDFVLRWAPKASDQPRVAMFSEEHDGEHYALLMVLPPELDAAAARLAREAIFVIDTSGSMGGSSIGQARAALHLALDHLAPGDTFNVIEFNSSARALFRQSADVTGSTVRDAHAFVDGLVANGGTEMLSALALALHDPLSDSQRVRQVIFITDGSIGNEAQLFAAIDRDLGDSRLFMVGIGSAPNAYLLNRAATFGRGTSTTIGSLKEVQDRMEIFFRKIESPVLSDLELHWNDVVEMWPERMPDLYAGEPVVVTARLARFVGDVRVTGERDSRAFDLRLPLTPGSPERGIHKLWARRKIAHWMAQRAFGTDANEVRENVLGVALEHQLVSKYTSLVAVDVTPLKSAEAEAAHSNVPNHGPAGFDPMLVPGVLPKGATPAPLLTWLGGTLLLAAAGLWRVRGRA